MERKLLSEMRICGECYALVSILELRKMSWKKGKREGKWCMVEGKQRNKEGWADSSL